MAVGENTIRFVLVRLDLGNTAALVGGLTKTRVLYDRVLKMKIYFEFTAFLNYEELKNSKHATKNKNKTVFVNVYI